MIAIGSGLGGARIHMHVVVMPPVAGMFCRLGRQLFLEASSVIRVCTCKAAPPGQEV